MCFIYEARLKIIFRSFFISIFDIWCDNYSDRTDFIVTVNKACFMIQFYDLWILPWMIIAMNVLLFWKYYYLLLVSYHKVFSNFSCKQLQIFIRLCPSVSPCVWKHTRITTKPQKQVYKETHLYTCTGSQSRKQIH